MRLIINPRSIFLILVYCCTIAKLFAAHDKIAESGKASAMANTSVTLTDIWSVYNNQAGLGYLEHFTIGVFHHSGFIKEQNTQGIAFAIPTKTGTIGATYSYFGFSQYNEMQAGLSFGRSFSKYFSIGLQLNYLHTHIEGIYGNNNSINFEIGILSQPIDNLLIGAHVYNPSHSEMGKEEIPTIFNLGISYLFSEKVLITVGTEKNLNHDAIFKTGIDYKPVDFISLQIGISTNPSQYSFGIGFHFKKTEVNLGFMNHQTLGFTPSLTLSHGF